MQPTEALLREYVPRRLKSLGLVKCSDMEMRFSRQGLAFAGQRRPTPGAKSPPPPGRRIELCYLTFGNGIRRAVECHEDGDGRTAMLPTTLAMTPSHRFRLTSSHKTDRPAEAATLELFAHDDPRIDREGGELTRPRLALHPSGRELSGVGDHPPRSAVQCDL